MAAENTAESGKPPLKVLLCSPRGFCAGVVRAIDSVERALALYGRPVYVRHEIVHNRYVVDSLKAKGAVFVEELDEIPDTKAPVIFSAHGVAKSVPEAATRRNLFALDATCPLVTKVHREAEIHHRRDREIVLIGHAGHPEVIGTMGQLPIGAVHLVETLADAGKFTPRDPDKLAYVTQTTLSLDDTAEIVALLKKRFPAIVGPHKEDICYATTNRQEAVKRVAPQVDAMIVVGAPNSSNSQRLKEVAERAGCPRAALVQTRRRHRLARVRQHHQPRHHRRRVCAGGAGGRDHRRLRQALHGRGGDCLHRRRRGCIFSAPPCASGQRTGGTAFLLTQAPGAVP
jgi:4-hydroxy-3-methylbut-2-en-1-yl diphosphate reductase